MSTTMMMIDQRMTMNPELLVSVPPLPCDDSSTLSHVKNKVNSK